MAVSPARAATHVHVHGRVPACCQPLSWPAIWPTFVVQAVEDKIRRWEENPDAEMQRAAAAREITVYFNSDVAGAQPGSFTDRASDVLARMLAKQAAAWIAYGGPWFASQPPTAWPSPPRTPADGMPWKFVPTQRSVKLHPGQSTLAFYTAENKADTSITGARSCAVVYSATLRRAEGLPHKLPSGA